MEELLKSPQYQSKFFDLLFKEPELNYYLWHRYRALCHNLGPILWRENPTVLSYPPPFPDTSMGFIRNLLYEYIRKRKEIHEFKKTIEHEAYERMHHRWVDRGPYFLDGHINYNDEDILYHLKQEAKSLKKQIKEKILNYKTE